MVNLREEIIFRDGITLDGVKDLTDEFWAKVSHICELGRYFGLSLDGFEMDSELVHFDWRGTKYDVLRFYTYYSKNMTSESLDERKTTQKVILNK